MKSDLHITLVKRLIFIVIALCFIVNAQATVLQIDLPYFNCNPTTNRPVTWQAQSPTIGNLFTGYSDSNGSVFFTNVPNTLLNINILAPPAKTFIQVQLLAGDTGTVNATNRLASGSSSTVPTGQTAWAIATSDQRYQLNGSSASNTFYPLFSNPSNYVSTNLLANATNAIYAMLPQTNNYTSIVVSNPSAFVTPASLIDATNRDYAAWLATIIATNAIAHTDMTNLYNQSGVNMTNLSVSLTNLSYLIGQAGTNNALTLGLADSNNVITASNALTVAYRATNAIAHTDMTNLATANSNLSYTIGSVATNLFNTAGVNMTNLSVAISNTIAGISANGISATAATNIIQNFQLGGVITNQTTNTIFSTAGTNAIQQIAIGAITNNYGSNYWTIGGNNPQSGGGVNPSLTTNSIGLNNISQSGNPPLFFNIRGQPALEIGTFYAGSGANLSFAPNINVNPIDATKNLTGSSPLLPNTIGSSSPFNGSPFGSSILGGQSNTIFNTSASPPFNSTLSAYVSDSTILGGFGNTITNASASVAGGFFAGVGSGHNGTFVWSDYSTNTQFASTSSNQFIVRVVNGFGINTNNPAGYALNVGGSINATNIYVNGAAVLTSTAGVQNTNTVGAGSHISIVTNSSGNSVVYVISADQQTNGFFLYSNFVYAVGLGNTNLSYLIGQGNTNLSYLIGTANTNYSLVVGLGSTNLINLYSTALTNFGNLIGQAATNYILVTGLGGTNLSYLIGQANTNHAIAVGLGATNLVNLYSTALSNDVLNAGQNITNTLIAGYVANTNGAAVNLTTKSNITLWPFPYITQSTNVVGINGAGISQANGTYIQLGNGTWTNVSGNGSDISFQNPTYFVRTNLVNLYSTGNLFTNGIYNNVIGSTAVPTNSGFGYVANYSGQWPTNIWAAGLTGIVPMQNLDTTKILTNNESAPVQINAGFTVSGGGSITAVVGGFIGGALLGFPNGTVTASTFNGGKFNGDGSGLSGISVTNANVITNTEANVSLRNYFDVHTELPQLTYSVTNPFYGEGMFKYPQFNGQYTWNPSGPYFTNSLGTNLLFFANDTFGGEWEFSTNFPDTSGTFGKYWIFSTGPFPTNTAHQAQWTFDPDFSIFVIPDSIDLGTTNGNINYFTNISAIPNYKTIISGSQDTSKNDDANHVIEFYDNSVSNGILIASIGDQSTGNQADGILSLTGTPNNGYGSLAGLFILNKGVRGEVTRWFGTTNNSISGVYEDEIAQLSDLTVVDYHVVDEYGHQMFGKLPHSIADTLPGLHSVAWSTFYGGATNSALFPNVLIAPAAVAGQLPTIMTNGAINSDGKNLYVDQNGSRGSVIVNSLVSKIPTAVSVGVSPFTFSNSTPNYLSLRVDDGAALFSITYNGVVVRSSLAGNYIDMLAPTNVIIITYPVTAPTFYTNSF